MFYTVTRIIRWIVGSVVVVTFSLGTFAPPLYAQVNPYPQPQIVFFGSEVNPAERVDAESLQVPVQVSWQVSPLMPHYRVTLHVFWDDDWQPLLSPQFSSLPAAGSVDLAIRWPPNNVPPTLRLVVLDENDTLLNQRVMLLASEFTEGSPLIAALNTPTTHLDASARAEVEIAWWVRFRHPHMRLVFEQIFDDGQVVTLDLPHPTARIPSQGSGYLIPTLPVSGASVQLRLRVINDEDDTTLAEQALPPIPVIAQGSSPPSADDTTSFCDDPRALELVESLRHAVRYHDGAEFASLISPQGLYMALVSDYTNYLTREEVRNFFDDHAMRSWGIPEYGPRDAPPIQASLGHEITAQLEIDLLPGKATIACNDDQDTKSQPGELYAITIPDYEIDNFYSIMRPGPPGWELNYSGWGLVIDYWHDQLVLVAMTNYTWMP